MTSQSHKRRLIGWEPLADWYDGWMGDEGSIHHRTLAIPAVLDLLELQPAQTVLDIGAGQGVLAPYVHTAAARYTGVEISRKLLQKAHQRHQHQGRFLHGDARHLQHVHQLRASSFDAVVFLLSIQDMNPLEAVIDSAAWALRRGGRLVILMLHPCFRVPRQSGWDVDPARQLRYRRVDSYLSPLNVPLKSYGNDGGKSISFHRPLSAYINTLATYDVWIDALREITAQVQVTSRAERRANAEIPLFLALRGKKM